MEKSIGDVTESEILRQQMELLAEASKEAPSTELPGLTSAMLDIYSEHCQVNSVYCDTFSAVHIHHWI